MLPSRLRMLIGVDFAAITEKHLQAFVDSRTSEDQDLDFKSKGYAPDNNGKREISKDIAALANHLGGLLIIGISEDGHGRANNLSPVRIQKGMELRIREILASCVSPMVQGVQVREVQSSANNELGYYLIAVPRMHRCATWRNTWTWRSKTFDVLASTQWHKHEIPSRG
jgi:Schlafen, AlbA_2